MRTEVTSRWRHSPRDFYAPGVVGDGCFVMGDTRQDGLMSFEDGEPDPEFMPDALAEPKVRAEQEPQSEPEYVDHVPGDAGEADATTGPA